MHAQPNPSLVFSLLIAIICSGWLVSPACQQHSIKSTESPRESNPIPDTTTQEIAPSPDMSNDKEPPSPPDTRTNPDTNAKESPSETPPSDSITPETKPDSPTATGVWGALQPIDVHAHIGSFSGYDLSTPTLMSNIRTYGIRWALISNIDGANLSATLNLDETKANQATIDTVRQYPDLLRGIYWTRPNKGMSSQIETFLQTKLPNQQRIFVGMKFHPNMNQFPADSALLDPYFKLCEKYKLVAVFHSDSPGTNADPQKIYDMAKRFPKVPVVLYHMGFFGPHTTAISVAQTALQKRDADLYLGSAQADPNDVLRATKLLGSTRVMFGTDATYFGKDHYGQYRNQIQTLQSGLSAQEFQNVIHNNAKTLFGLP